MMLRCLFGTLFVLAVSGQQCTDSTSLRSRYGECLNAFLNNLTQASAGNTSQPTCSEAKSSAKACIESLLSHCSTDVTKLPQIFNPGVLEMAFQFACDSSTEIALAHKCYSGLNNGTLESCEKSKIQELTQLRGLRQDAKGNQQSCVTIDAHFTCLRTNLQTVCPDESNKLTAFLSLFFPANCSQIIASYTDDDTSSNCRDEIVVRNFTECVKPFFERIEKLDLDKKKCNDSVLETLQCVRTVVAKCAPTARFQYIQKLLDLQRTKDALDFGCRRDWDLAKGAFCYNKHYGSDIKPCLDKKMSSGEIYSEESGKTFESACRYIDATTDCARTGMETCKEEAVTFSEYVRMFFPGDCTDDKAGASTLQVFFGLLTTLISAHILLW